MSQSIEILKEALRNKGFEYYVTERQGNLVTIRVWVEETEPLVEQEATGMEIVDVA